MKKLFLLSLSVFLVVSCSSGDKAENVAEKSLVASEEVVVAPDDATPGCGCSAKEGLGKCDCKCGCKEGNECTCDKCPCQCKKDKKEFKKCPCKDESGKCSCAEGKGQCACEAQGKECPCKKWLEKKKK